MLQYFLAVAQPLYLTQPTLSRQLRALEEELGMYLVWKKAQRRNNRKKQRKNRPIRDMDSELSQVVRPAQKRAHDRKDCVLSGGARCKKGQKKDRLSSPKRVAQSAILP